MKIEGLLLSLFLLSFFGNGLGQCLEDWAVYQTAPLSPDPFNVSNSPYSVAVDASDNIYSIGNFIGALNWYDQDGLSQTDLAASEELSAIVLAKHDPEGKLLWTNVLETGGDPHFHPDVLVQGAQVIICGTYEDSLWIGQDTLRSGRLLGGVVASFNLEGDLLWLKNLGLPGANVLAHGLATDVEGNILVTGRFSGEWDITPNIPLLTADPDFFFETFLLKISPQGQTIWGIQSESGVNSQVLSRGLAIEVNKDNEVVLGGYFADTIQFSGGPLVVSDGQGQSGYIAVFDAGTGALKWIEPQVAFGSGFASVTYYDLTVDEDNFIYAIGALREGLSMQGDTVVSNGQFDAYLLKIDPTGELIWHGSVGEMGNPEWGGAITITPYQTLLCAMNLKPGATFGEQVIEGTEELDLVIVEVNKEGFLVGYEHFGGAEDEFCYGITLDGEGQLIGVGETRSMTSTYGSASLQTPAGDSSYAFLFKRCLNLVPVSDVEPETATIFPNPTRDFLFIEWEYPSGQWIMKLFQSNGQFIWQHTTTGFGAIELPDLAAGVYFLHLEDEKGRTQVHRLLIY